MKIKILLEEDVMRGKKLWGGGGGGGKRYQKRVGGVFR